MKKFHENPTMIEIGRRTSVAWERATAFPSRLERRIRPSLPVPYALLLEATELGLIAFAALLTVEAVLPGIISIRLNLAVPFTGILILFTAAAALGWRLGISFPFAPDKKNPLTWIGISWLAFLLTLSTIRFPYWSIPVIVGGLFLCAHLFWKLLFRSEKAQI